MIAWLFDLLLGAALIGLAVRSLWGRNPFDGVMAFIGLGVLMALAWVRLGALDLALAEAVLGGGVTGALLLGAIRRLRETSAEARETDNEA